MKAIRYHRYGPADVMALEEVPVPRPGAREVLVKVHATALNPVDCEIRKGRLSFLLWRFPRIPGSDFSGEVVAVGSKVRGFHPGDLVYGMSPAFQGGAYAEYVSVRRDRLAFKPTTLGFGEAAGIPLAALTALQSLRDLADLQRGQKVFIHGASGGVGIFAIQLAHQMGAHVTASSSARNLDFIRSLGADVCLDYATTDIAALPERFDVFFDVYGNHSFGRVHHLLTPAGTHVTTIPTIKNISRHFLRPFAAQKAKMVAVQSRRDDLDHLRILCDRGLLKTITDRIFPLAQAVEAQEFLETRRARGKVVLEVIPS